MIPNFNSISMLEEKVRELEMVFQLSQDEIFVTDAKGVCTRVNPACIRHYGLQGIDLIGKSVFVLEQEGIFYPSATVRVIENRQTVSLIQTTLTNRKLFVTANPVFDGEGNLISIVSNSSDITEILTLKKKVEEMERTILEYNRQLEHLQKSAENQGSLIAKSPAMRQILQLLERVAYVDTSVLLLGESGVGKTEVARWLHQISNRKKMPFVEVNCSAIPSTLFEPELFGYEPGTFSGGLSTGKKGLIETANNGTLFLDEIGELPLDLQTKLLQVIQNKFFMRVGGRELKRVDVRFIAATNRDLAKMVAENKFRQDLYYRLNVVQAIIPPLRDRKEDLIELMFTILNRVNDKYQFEKILSPQVMDELLGYSWPGNIRELENTLERLALTSKGKIIEPIQLFETPGIGIRPQISSPIDAKDYYISTLISNPKLNYTAMLEKVEADILSHFLTTHGSTRRMSERLGISQSTISRKCQRFGLY